MLASADLDGHDRLPDLERVVGQGEEALGTLEALDEQDDRGRCRIVEAIGEVIAHIEHDLGAAADDPREADPVAGMDERIGHRPRLRDPGHPAARQVRRHVADVCRAVGGQVDHAHAVRPDEGESVIARDPRNVGLHRLGRRSALDDATTRDDHRRNAGRSGLGGDRGGTQRVDRHDRDVRAFGQRLDRRIARLAVEFVVLGIDEMAAGRAVHHAQVVTDGFGDPRAWRRPDDGHAARREQGPQVDGALRSRWSRRHPTTRPTPRFSSARAMITRWISDVPSQMRSTRNSRRNRSGANSRM